MFLTNCFRGIYVQRYDVVICGAGPAGLSTGISILRHEKNAEVLILESREEVGEEKCGEGLGRDWLYKHLDNFGSFLLSKLSKKCFENDIYGFTLFLPSGRKITARAKEPQGWILNKDFFLKNLAKIFEKLGGEVKTKWTLPSPIASIDRESPKKTSCAVFINASIVQVPR